MKKFSFLLLAFPFIFTACKTKCIEDSGIRVEHEKVFKAFDKLEVEGPIKVVINQDSTYKIRIAADSNVVDEIKASVSSGTLKLKLDAEKYCGTDSIVIHAGVKYLKSLNLKSGSEIYSSSLLNFRDVELKLNGVTKVDIKLTTGILKTNIEGTANIKLVGQAGEHNIKSNGVLTLDAFDFVVAKYDLNAEGVNKSNINVLNVLKVETSGTSEIYYKGSPKDISKKKTGNAKLEKVN